MIFRIVECIYLFPLEAGFWSNLTVSFVISEFSKVKTTQATHLEHKLGFILSVKISIT